jgi:hypothetical protein
LFGVSPASLSFGDVQVGLSKELTLTLSNTGNATMTGSVAGGTGFADAGFSLQSGGGDYSLGGGQSKAVLVRLAPTSVGSKTSSLAITHNASNAANPLSVPLMCTVYLANMAPVAVGDTATTQPGASISISVLNNDLDPNGDGVQLTGIAALPARGIAVPQEDGTILYSPFDTFTEGSDTFAYQITDGTLTATGEVVIHVVSAVAMAPEGPADGFALEQNYPNPFNPSTTVSYSIHQPGKVLLRVFDGVGRCVGTLVDRGQPAGQHRVVFDARDLPSGSYFLVLEYAGKARVIGLTLSK